MQEHRTAGPELRSHLLSLASYLDHGGTMPFMRA
jgi:hypothetical protein